MRLNQQKLTRFIEGLHKKKTLKSASPKTLAKKIAEFLESHPSCLEPFEPSAYELRFSYSTVGYGIFSLLGEKYRMGRIEVVDQNSTSSYHTDEGTYCMPYEAASQFEHFINSLQTDLPIQIAIGSVMNCQEECAKALGLNSVEDMRREEIIEKFNTQKREDYALSQGFKSWEEYVKENPI